MHRITPLLTILHMVFPIGLHNHHVLPAVMERQAPLLHWHSSQPHPGQPSGRPAVGT